MAQSLSEGSVFNYTTTGAVANGDLMVVGQRVGVALESATGANKVIALALDGVFEVLCAATGTMTAGNAAYYRRTATGYRQSRVTIATGGATGLASGMGRTVGMFWETKGATSGRSKIKVKLVGGPMPWA
jgi:predicted RecA/RadA family phage recombinase